MTKQEKIRERITELFKIARQEGALRKWADGEGDAYETLSYLHSQGVVIKDRCYGMGMDTRGGYNWKGVFFVVPLIKEESDGNNEVP